jgi:hypothetical protein
VTLTIDLLKSQSKTLDDYRDFHVTLSPVLLHQTAATKDPQWDIHGRVRALLYFDKAIAELGRHSELSQPLSPLRLRIKAAAQLSQFTAECSSPEIGTKLTHVDPATPLYDLEIMPPAHMPKGPINQVIALTACVSNTARPVVYHLPVTGAIVDDIESSSSEIILGPHALGEVVEEVITLHSLTNRAFTVLAMTTNLSGSCLKPYHYDEFQGRCFLFRQQIARIGDCRGTVTFYIEADSGKHSQIVVATSYWGTEGSGTHNGIRTGVKEIASPDTHAVGVTSNDSQQ